MALLLLDRMYLKESISLTWKTERDDIAEKFVSVLVMRFLLRKEFYSVHLWGRSNIWVPPALIRSWISSALSFWEVSSPLLSRIFPSSPSSLLTCSSHFSAPAVYSNSYADRGYSSHPWWEKQRSCQRCSAHAHGYTGPGHRSGNGAEHRLCHKPLQGPAPTDLHGNGWLGNGSLLVSDLFCSYPAQLARRGDKHKIKCVIKPFFSGPSDGSTAECEGIAYRSLLYYVHRIWSTLILQHGIHLDTQMPQSGHQIVCLLTGDPTAFFSEQRARMQLTWMQVDCWTGLLNLESEFGHETLPSSA